jgi:branched-chain amino acid transport system substrate-binding protein
MFKNPSRREVLGRVGAVTAAAAAGGLALPAFAQTTPGVTDNEIVIGYHGPMTGPASWVGLGGRDGALLALDEINAAGGVNGRKIRLVAYDDAGKASEAEAVARKMIDSDKVFGILGGGISGVAIVVGEEAHRAKVPYLNGTAGSPKVIDQQSRWVFSGATLDGRDIGYNQATFIGEHLKVKKVAVMHGTDEFSQGLQDTVTKILKERYGVEVLTTQKYNPGDTDFSSQLLAVKQTNPELILLFGLYVEAARAVRQARELGIRTPIKGDNSMMNAGFLTVAGTAAEGMVVEYISPYFNGDPAKDMVEFEARYKKKYPSYPAERPNYCDVWNYGNMYALAEGLKRAGRNVTRRGFVEALETLKEWRAPDTWPGSVHVIQPLTFASSHNGNRRLSFFRVTGGKFVPITDFKAPVPTTPFPANASLKW